MKKRSSIKLDKSFAGHPAKKHRCPSCGQKRFVRYFDFDKGDYLPERYGRCDREEHCGYFEHPFEDLKQAREAEEFHHVGKQWTPPPPAPIKPVDKEIVKRSLTSYRSNTFVQYLASLVGWEKAEQAAISNYLGTARDGSVIFWFVDDRFRVRTGSKIMYNPTTGNRIRGQSFDASRLFKVTDGYTPCLFGQHQLWSASDAGLVGIVESEKSAIHCSFYLPNIGGRPIIWLASSGINGLSYDKCRCLEGREVLLVPDFSFHARATWGLLPMRKKRNEKGNLVPHPDGDIVEGYESAADRLRKIGAQVRFYDAAPEVEDGTDIADLLAGQPMPVAYEPPNFQSLVFDAPEAATGDIEEDIPQSVTLPITGIAPFIIKHHDSGRLEVLSEYPHARRGVERMMKKWPNVAELVNVLHLCTGSIQPIS